MMCDDANASSSLLRHLVSCAWCVFTGRVAVGCRPCHADACLTPQTNGNDAIGCLCNDELDLAWDQALVEIMVPHGLLSAVHHDT